MLHNSSAAISETATNAASPRIASVKQIHKFCLSKSDITVRNNRNEIAAFTLSGPADGKYELSIPSINANRLSRTYNVSLKGVSFTYGPYNYCSYAIGATEAEILRFTVQDIICASSNATESTTNPEIPEEAPIG